MNKKIPVMNIVEKEVKSHDHKTNLCSNCECVGDLKRCMETKCFLHESWLVKELRCHVNFAEVFTYQSLEKNNQKSNLIDKDTSGCGRKECRVSKGICGSITFGTGELSFNGYWEFPCKKCEEAHREYIKQMNRK